MSSVTLMRMNTKFCTKFVQSCWAEMFAHTINHALPGFYQRTTGLVSTAPLDFSSSVFLSALTDLVTLQFRPASCSSWDKLSKRGHGLCKLQSKQILHFGSLWLQSLISRVPDIRMFQLAVLIVAMQCVYLELLPVTYASRVWGARAR